MCNNFLIYRTGKLLVPDPTNDYKDENQLTMYQEIYDEALYYGLINICNTLHVNNIGYYSSILNDKTFSILKSWMNDTSTQNWKLLYRASKDGFTSNTFHAKCDGINNTLIIIKANNKIFGGFTPLQWSNNNKDTIYMTNNNDNTNHNIEADCLNTFVYLIDEPNNINWKKNFKKNIYANNDFISIPIGYNKNYGPIFGKYSNIKNGNKGIKPVSSSTKIIAEGIIISNKCNENNNSCWTYSTHFDTPTNNTNLAGSKHFFVNDIEVYHIK